MWLHAYSLLLASSSIGMTEQQQTSLRGINNAAALVQLFGIETSARRIAECKYIARQLNRLINIMINEKQ